MPNVAAADHARQLATAKAAVARAKKTLTAVQKAAAAPPPRAASAGPAVRKHIVGGKSFAVSPAAGSWKCRGCNFPCVHAHRDTCHCCGTPRAAAAAATRARQAAVTSAPAVTAPAAAAAAAITTSKGAQRRAKAAAKAAPTQASAAASPAAPADDDADEFVDAVEVDDDGDGDGAPGPLDDPIAAELEGWTCRLPRPRREDAAAASVAEVATKFQAVAASFAAVGSACPKAVTADSPLGAPTDVAGAAAAATTMPVAEGDVTTAVRDGMRGLPAALQNIPAERAMAMFWELAAASCATDAPPNVKRYIEAEAAKRKAAAERAGTAATTATAPHPPSKPAKPPGPRSPAQALVDANAALVKVEGNDLMRAEVKREQDEAQRRRGEAHFKARVEQAEAALATFVARADEAAAKWLEHRIATTSKFEAEVAAAAAAVAEAKAANDAAGPMNVVIPKPPRPPAAPAAAAAATSAAASAAAAAALMGSDTAGDGLEEEEEDGAEDGADEASVISAFIQTPPLPAPPTQEEACRMQASKLLLRHWIQQSRGVPLIFSALQVTIAEIRLLVGPVAWAEFYLDTAPPEAGDRVPPRLAGILLGALREADLAAATQQSASAASDASTADTLIAAAKESIAARKLAKAAAAKKGKASAAPVLRKAK